MKQHCAIISGGRFSELNGIEAADFVIACDKGVEYAAHGGVLPDLLVGDFDSYHGALPEGVPVLELPVEKDDTDTMAAIRWAVGEGYSEITTAHWAGGSTICSETFRRRFSPSGTARAYTSRTGRTSCSCFRRTRSCCRRETGGRSPFWP